MNDPTNSVGVLELRRLLFEIKEHRPDICFRYRLMGNMWTEDFHRVINVTDKGLVLGNEVSNTLVTVSNLTHIIQFELDHPFQSYKPYFHYEVVPSREWQ